MRVRGEEKRGTRLGRQFSCPNGLDLVITGFGRTREREDLWMTVRFTAWEIQTWWQLSQSQDSVVGHV